jgi:rhamnosyltransferase subunit B
MTAKRIVMATFGSLGDLHPYIAVALELKRRGHLPAIATTDRYRNTVESLGIAFTSMCPLEDQLGDLTEIVSRVFNVRRGTEYLIKDLVMPYVREAYRDLSRAAADADLLVTHPLAFAGRLLAEKKNISWASTVLAPLSLMSAIDPPLFAQATWLRSVRRLGPAPYRWLLGAIKFSCRRWERPLAEFRRELGLPYTRQQALFDGQFSPALNLALFSGEIARPQVDWPINTKVCGFARYDGASIDPASMSRLEAFLAAGDPPLVFALGSSAVMIAGDFWKAAIDAVRRLRRRAILITGKDLPAPTTSAQSGEPEQIETFAYLPYSSVFSRAAAIVHQGGIGTLSQALAAGRPQLIVPIAFDQPDNAERAARLGVARTLSFAKAKSDRLAVEISRLTEDLRYEERARELGSRVSRENGAAIAADRLLELCSST